MFNVIGASSTGLAVAGALLHCGHEVCIIDDFENAPDAKWWLVCVETPVYDNCCDYTAIRTALRGCRGRTVVLSALYPNNNIECDVYHPVFLRTGSEIQDYLEPCKVILGGSASVCSEFWADTGIHCIPTIISRKAADWVKLIHSAWICNKISFVNEIADIAPVDAIAAALEENHMRPGPPFDGPCLPRDACAIYNLGGTMLKAPWVSNRKRIEAMISKLHGKVGVCGLAYRPGSDDMRSSLALEVMIRFPHSIGWDPVIKSWNIRELARDDKQVLQVANRVVDDMATLDLCDTVLLNNPKYMFNKGGADVYAMWRQRSSM
jgi:UDP-glucose 6-dehydrogenase